MYQIYLAAILEQLFSRSLATERDFGVRIAGLLVDQEPFSLREEILNYSGPVRFFTPAEFISDIEKLKHTLTSEGFTGLIEKPNPWDHAELPESFLEDILAEVYPPEKTFLLFLCRVILQVVVLSVVDVDKLEAVLERWLKGVGLL